MLEGGNKYTKNGPEMGATIGGDSKKSGKNTYLLVIMRVRLSKKIGLVDLMNCTRFKKGNGYWGIYLMLNTPYIYYGHTNVFLLGVCQGSKLSRFVVTRYVST